MNFCKDFIRHIEGQNISRTVKEVKNIAGKITDELAPGTSKDISKGVSAEDSMGRAAFSMMNKLPQFKLQEKFSKICEELNLSETYKTDRIREICSTNNELNQELILTSEEFIKLAKAKPESQQWCWETYFPDLIQNLKNTDGTINKDIYESTKTLLKDHQISTRGIPDIIQGCTEWIKNEKGEFTKHFNKNMMDKYRDFMDINGKTMHEQDDVFTLYLGKTLNGCRLEGKWLPEGQEQIIDNVAWNFAKKMYQQGQDIIHMNSFLEQFHNQIQENGHNVVSGFKFIPTENNKRWATKMIEDLKKSCGNELSEKCKIDGKDNLHNLLVADTLKQETGMYNGDIVHIIERFKNEEGIVPSNFVSYICREGKNANSLTASNLKACLRTNGAIDGHVWRQVVNKEINANELEYCRVDGELNYDNIDVLKELCTKIKENDKYEYYHIKGVFEQLKNKNGVVDKTLLAPLDELIQYTHLAPQELKDCLNLKGEVDEILFDLKKDIIKHQGYYSAEIPDICKNADGTANIKGVDAVKTMINTGLGNNQIVVNTFKSEQGYNYQGLKDFAKEYASTDKRYRGKILNMSISGEYRSNKEVRTINLNKFKSLKEAMTNPEIAPLMENYDNAMIIQTKFEPYKISSKKPLNEIYGFEHLKLSDVEILEKNGYPARFYKELGREEKFFVDVTSSSLRKFEQEFIKGTTLEQQLANTKIEGDISLGYSTEQLFSDINKTLEKVSDDEKATLIRAFRLEFGQQGIEGFPQRFEVGTTPPKDMEEAFISINDAINKFYSTGLKSDNPELAKLSDEIITGFPEFKMLIGKVDKNGERIDIKTLQQLKKLTLSPEYNALPTEDKAVAKMTILLNNLENINSRPSILGKGYVSDNDGLAVHISAQWKKQSEYASSILDRYNLSEQAKYRTTQLINDIGWSKELESGVLTHFDIAVNQRYKGDEKVSPLIEKTINGEFEYDKSAIEKEVQNIRKNQQLFMPTTIAELEPYIQTTKMNGKELKYIDLDRPELQNKAFLSHFLGYDHNDHTLKLLKNRAYRSTFSASVIKGGEHSSCFAGRNTGIVLETDNVNVALTYHTNIDTGFGKQYTHLKKALKSGGAQEIKSTIKETLKLSEEEYAQLMEQTVHSNRETLTDVTINGRRISKEEIKKAHDKGIERILSYQDQNETTVLNPRPVAIIGIGDSIDAYEVSKAVTMAQANDMVMLFKRNH